MADPPRKQIFQRAVKWHAGPAYVPAHAAADPLFLLATNLKLTDTYFVLILIIVASNQPFAIWLMRGFLISLPKELDEAARIDGCGMLKTVTRVIFPLSMPGSVRRLFSPSC